MKKIFVLILLIIAANIFLARTLHFKNSGNDPIDTSKSIHPLKYMANEDELITTLLQRYHYRKFQLNDSLSGVIFDRYIKSLDDNKSYFNASDIADFSKYKYQFANDIKEGNLNPPFMIFNVFKNRMDERINYAERILDKGFNFNEKDEMQIDREKASWAKDSLELNDIWYKRTKNDELNLILAGKKPDEVKSTLEKRYENLRKSLLQYTDEDVFQLFENSFTESLDPHTDYMSPSTSDNFKIDMSRSLEGIGAQLQTEDEYTKIAEIIPGGPAFKCKLLHSGDKIVGVAQGKEGDFVDIIGWRVTDVVQLIRGPKGSVVRLQILPANQGSNTKPNEITLVRDKITLEEQSAKSQILNINDNNKTYKLGVITIPAFYSDFDAEERGDKDYKSTTKDVQKLLAELMKENIQGVVIDLRNDGGGSLEEAIKLTGLFIKGGPVVQIKNSDGSIRVESVPDPAIQYSGPLVILENRLSASASEIFAAAIQDYGRGLIIGEQSYGKGTVQNLIDLNRLMPETADKLGQIKLTIAKFYRINGESTQHLGVLPDIKFPSAFDTNEIGESSEPSSLPWDQIKPTSFTTFGNLKQYVPDLITKHEERIKNNNPLWQEYMDEVNDYKEGHNKTTISLNESIRKKEHDEEEQKQFERENEIRKNLGLKLLQKGETPPANEAQKDDPLLNETGHILADYIAIIS
jgi:carboxyl-terminal processing protease